MSSPTQRALLEAGAYLLFERAQRDTVLFCRLYRPQVIHPTRGSIPFDPYPAQLEILRQLDRNKSMLIVKSRQTGISTTVLMHRLRACLVPNTTHVVISAKAHLAAELIGIARHAALTCSPPFPYPITIDNKLELGFANGSRIVGESSTPESGRTYAATTALLDEVRALGWPRETWQSLAPTTTHGGSLCLISTPDIEGSFFHEHYLRVQTNPEGWAYAEVHWSAWPNRDRQWAEQTRETLGLTQAEWAQEFELQWGSLSSAIFSKESIERALELGRRKSTTTPEHPTYVMGVDIAKGGSGRDASVVVVLEVSSDCCRIAMAKELGELPAPTLELQIEKLAEQYKARVYLDCTGIGWGVVSHLRCNAIGITFTGGTNVSRGDLGYNVPRTKLLSNLALGLERGEIALSSEYPELIAALRSAQVEKRRGLYVDWLDALALAYWGHTGVPRTGVADW